MKIDLIDKLFAAFLVISAMLLVPITIFALFIYPLAVFDII